MWKLIQEKVESNQVQVVLHLGDQVYGQKELIDSFVILRQAKQDGINTPEEIKAVSERVQGRLADIYRFTWNLPRTAKSLASGSHLMIWSDNDLYNDFTIAKSETTGAALENLMIHYGHLVYRRYQRQLWDPNYESNTSPAEEHYHKYGPIGILLVDMRGNRIDWNGNQHADSPIVSESQWKLIDSVFADPELKVILVCSEIPFVGDTPEVAKTNSTKPGLEFLKDHWVYSPSELVRLLETAFDWKAANPQREVVFIGGDIHVGVDSEIRDSKTKLTIRHLTATPITNHVCKFFPALEGAVNERFSYVHKPLAVRNYGLIDITIQEDGAAKVEAQLVPDPNPKAHH
jgi:phosphodiesterase/alkaline phosphatase D-like protein